jgi:hypothetical protein
MANPASKSSNGETLEVRMSYWWFYILAAIAWIGVPVCLYAAVVGPNHRNSLLAAGGSLLIGAFFALIAKLSATSGSVVMRLTSEYLEFPAKKSFVLQWSQLSHAEVVQINTPNGLAHYLGLNLTPEAKKVVTIPSSLKAISIIPKLVTQRCDILLNADSFNLTAQDLVEAINDRVMQGRH